MLPEAELRRLASRLSPSVRKQLFSHLAGDSAPPSPPRPRVTAPTPTTCGTGVGSEPPRRQQAPFENPLLTTAEVQALIPAVIPNARRWLREVDLSARNAAANQKELKELGRFVIKTEQARQASEAERARLYHLCEQQSQALVASAARMASQRRAYVNRAPVSAGRKSIPANSSVACAPWRVRKRTRRATQGYSVFVHHLSMTVPPPRQRNQACQTVSWQPAGSTVAVQL